MMFGSDGGLRVFIVVLIVFVWRLSVLCFRSFGVGPFWDYGYVGNGVFHVVDGCIVCGVWCV